MKHGIRTFYVGLGVLSLGACAALVLATLSPTPADAADDILARGDYILTTTGCDDCHTPKKMVDGMPMPDMTRRLAGHPAGAPHPTWSPQDLMERHALFLGDPNMTAWAGPWGVSFSSNLTPDSETGLGEWTEEAFVQAMRTGKHQGQPNGRPILPPMPWHALAQMSDDDLSAIWASLRSVPPVANAVPTPIPPAGPPHGDGHGEPHGD